MIFGLLAALAATVGTFMQAWQALNDVARSEDAVPGLAVQDLRDEVPLWRLRQWRRHRAEVRQLMAESPAERESWLRLRRVLYGWGLMTLAAVYVLIDQLLGLI